MTEPITAVPVALPPGTTDRILGVLTDATASDAVKLSLVAAVAAVVLLLVWTRRPTDTSTAGAADALRLAAGAIAETAQQVGTLAEAVREIAAEVKELRGEVHRLAAEQQRQSRP